MKIELIKNWRKPTGKVIKKGTQFHVTMELGAEMIAKRLAKRVKDDRNKLIQKDDIDGDTREI